MANIKNDNLDVKKMDEDKKFLQDSMGVGKDFKLDKKDYVIKEPKKVGGGYNKLEKDYLEYNNMAQQPGDTLERNISPLKQAKWAAEDRTLKENSPVEEVWDYGFEKGDLGFESTPEEQKDFITKGLAEKYGVKQGQPDYNKISNLVSNHFRLIEKDTAVPDKRLDKIAKKYKTDKKFVKDNIEKEYDFLIKNADFREKKQLEAIEDPVEREKKRKKFEANKEKRNERLHRRAANSFKEQEEINLAKKEKALEDAEFDARVDYIDKARF